MVPHPVHGEQPSGSAAGSTARLMIGSILGFGFAAATFLLFAGRTSGGLVVFAELGASDANLPRSLLVASAAAAALTLAAVFLLCVPSLRDRRVSAGAKLGAGAAGIILCPFAGLLFAVAIYKLVAAVV